MAKYTVLFVFFKFGELKSTILTRAEYSWKVGIAGGVDGVLSK